MINLLEVVSEISNSVLSTKELFISLNTLISTILGGYITLMGVFFTIKAQRKKDHEDYIERIKPFLTVDNQVLQYMDRDEQKTYKHKVFIKDDSEKGYEPDATLNHFKSIFLSNVGEDICMINYVKVEDKTYQSYENIPIKANSQCVIRFYPTNIYISEKIENISIGVLDKRYNQYEYKLNFETKDCKEIEISTKFQNNVNKKICFSCIDCRSNYIQKG